MSHYDLYETVESIEQEVTDIVRHWRHRYYYTFGYSEPRIEDPDREHMLDHYSIINLRVAYLLRHC